MHICLVGKPERRKQLGIPMWRWKNNIKINLSERELGGFDRD